MVNDTSDILKKRWYKEFYQYDTKNLNGFYCSQRRCNVILEEMYEYKHNVFMCKVVEIHPLEDFTYRGVCGSCRLQFTKNMRFKLRKHSNSIYKDMYFDVSNSSNPDYEGFRIIEN